MKKIFGLTIGGLQQKILNLVLIFILAIVAVFAVVTVYQSSKLSKIVENAGQQQEAAIQDVSSQTMNAVINSSMVRTTKMEAYMANDIFNDVKSDVMTLQTFAQGLFAHPESFTAQYVGYSDPSTDGTAAVAMQHEEGMDPYSSASLGLVGNMKDVLTSMYVSSDKLSSCFVATADGAIVFCDDRAGEYVDENGNVEKIFEVTQRPWYKLAAEKGEVCFTGIELDMFTEIPGIVCAAPVYKDGELVAVVGADIFLNNIADYVQDSASDGGFLCVVNDEGKIVFSPNDEGTFKAATTDEAVDLRQSENKQLADFINRSLTTGADLTTVNVDGKDYYLSGAPMSTMGWSVISVLEKNVTDMPGNTMIERLNDVNEGAQEDFEDGMKHSVNMILVLIVAVLSLGSIAALTLAKRIVKPIEHMTKRARELNGKDYAFKMEDIYRTNDEIEELALSFEELSERTLKYIEKITHITKEKERIQTELELATRIQANMLPNLFPAFPERPEFDIYASMTPAKEVGGDFYDFFLIDDDHLALVMADVSGKGVPAALFMMMSKILVNNFAMMGGSPAKVLEQLNATICNNNEEEMFVTLWFGILEISTGKVIAANAGHEYPMISDKNGKFELFKDKHGFVIGGMEGVKYKEYEFTLEKGASLFLYTDGIAEATNSNNEMFGTDRMLQILNRDNALGPQKLLEHMKDAVDEFAGEAEQFDDMTMLGVQLL